MAQLKGDQGGQRLCGGNVVQGKAQYFATGQSNVSFSRFNGKYLNGWLYRCHQFFKVDGTPPKAMVKLATISFEGKTLQWHQNWVKYKKDTANIS